MVWDAPTEREWFETVDVREMFRVVRGASDRKYRLFACACCRRIWHLIAQHDAIRSCIEFAEGYADGVGAKKRLKKLVDANHDQFYRYGGKPGEDISVAFAASAARSTCRLRASEEVMSVCGSIGRVTGDSSSADFPTQSVLLRDIFGNPFRPVALDPRWRNETVVALASGIYADRAFDRMPILADALEEAGCDDLEVLNHCRGPGPHVRGCWVVDLVLGKE